MEESDVPYDRTATAAFFDAYGERESNGFASRTISVTCSPRPPMPALCSDPSGAVDGGDHRQIATAHLVRKW